MERTQLNNCITSAMIGDAIGLHVECASETVVNRLVEVIRLQKGELSFDVLKSFQIMDWKTKEIYKSGQVSDDSQCILALAHAFVEQPNEPYKALADNMLELFETEQMVSYGDATKHSMMQYKETKIWENNGEKGIKSNGSAMRVAPLGVLFKDDDEQLLKASFTQSSITHNSATSKLSSVALSIAVSCVSRGVTDYNDIVSEIMHKFLELQKSTDITDEDITVFIPYLNYTLTTYDEAKDFILDLDSEQSNQDVFGISAYAPTGVFWSIYCFCLNVDDFWDCMADVISIGGDTDTVACMAGAIFGANQVPENIGRFKTWLHDREKQIKLF